MKKYEIAIEKVSEKTNFSWWEIIGLACGLAAVIISCGEYRYKIFYTASGMPTAESGLFAFVFTAILYWRGLIAFKNNNLFWRLISIIINITIFTSLFSLLMSSTPRWERDTFFTAMLAVCTASIIFSMKGVAKLVMILSLFILSIKSLRNLSDAMGVLGYVYEILVFSSFYCQGNIKFKGLVGELKILYGKAAYTIIEASEEAEKDLKTVGDTVKTAVKTGTMA